MKQICDESWIAILLLLPLPGKGKIDICRVVHPQLHHLWAVMSAPTTPASFAFLMWIGGRVGGRRGVEREKKNVPPHYITCHFSRKLHNTSHVSAHHEWQLFYLQIFTLPILYPVAHKQQYGSYRAGIEKKKIIIISEVNYWISILDFNPLTVPGAWCPASGEPRQSLDSLWRPAERNVQRNGNHNTLRPPRLLLKAFTVHWLRYSTKHW